MTRRADKFFAKKMAGRPEPERPASVLLQEVQTVITQQRKPRISMMIPRRKH